MDDSNYVETRLAACLKEHDLPVNEGALAKAGLFRVVVGAYVILPRFGGHPC